MALLACIGPTRTGAVRETGGAFGPVRSDFIKRLPLNFVDQPNQAAEPPPPLVRAPSGVVLFEPSAGRLLASFDSDTREGHFGPNFVGGERWDNSKGTWWALPVGTVIYTPVAGLVLFNGDHTGTCQGDQITPQVILDMDPGLTWQVAFGGLYSSLKPNTFIEAGTLVGVVTDEGLQDAPYPCREATLGLTVYDYSNHEPVDPWTTALTQVDPGARQALMRP